MNPSTSFFQISSSIDPVLLVEWLLASIVLVVVVTLLYVFVLGKSPPPEGLTVAKVEVQQQQQTQLTQSESPSSDVGSTITLAEESLRAGNFTAAVDYSAQAVSASLKSLISRSSSQVPESMGINDLAYLAQSRAKSAPQFAEPTYRLSNLRLKAVQNQPVTPEEANWAVSFAKWLAQASSSDQIRF